MRESKFRVYCGVPYGIERGMHNVEVISFEDERVEFYAIDLHDCESVNFCYPFSDVEIMQYTGIKDKNGVEIYEGDIIKHNNCYWFVKFTKGAYSLYHSGLKDHDNTYLRWGLLNRLLDTDMGDILEHIAVVGNIYENKELLEIKE